MIIKVYADGRMAEIIIYPTGKSFSADMLVRVMTTTIGITAARIIKSKPGWEATRDQKLPAIRRTQMTKPELKPVTETEPETEIDPAIEAISTPAAADPFDLNKLRLDQSFVESAGVKKLLTKVPVQKPDPQEFCSRPSERKISYGACGDLAQGR